MTPAEPGHEVTIASRRGFDGKLLHVRVDTVRLPSGRESVREVIEHPGAVAIVAVTVDDEVLLSRQFRYAVGETLLEIPAGTAEPDEAPVTTARRELIEETGYEPGRLTELASYFSSAGFLTERMTLFRADDCRPVSARSTADDAERIALVAVPRASIPDLIASAEIRDAKSLIGLLWLIRNGG